MIHSSKHKKLASTFCAKLSIGDRGVDTLIERMRGKVFPLTEHESKELLPSWRTLVQTKRRILLFQMDPVIDLSEGH